MIISIVLISIGVIFICLGIVFAVNSVEESNTAIRLLILLGLGYTTIGVWEINETLVKVIACYVAIPTGVFLMNKLFDNLGAIIGIVASPLWLVYCLLQRKIATIKGSQSS